MDWEAVCSSSSKTEPINFEDECEVKDGMIDSIKGSS